MRHRPLTLQTYFIDALLDKILKELRAMDMLFERIISSTLDELLTKVVRFSKQDFVLSMPDHSQRLRDLRSEVHRKFRQAMDNRSSGQYDVRVECKCVASLYRREILMQAQRKT